MARLYVTVLRHGEALYLSDNSTLEQAFDLTEHGVRQMEAAAEGLCRRVSRLSIPAISIRSSHLARALHSSRLLLEAAVRVLDAHTDVTTCTELAEDFNHDPLDGFDDARRMMRVLQELAGQRGLLSDEYIVLVTHDMLMRDLWSLLPGDAAADVGNACGLELERRADGDLYVCGRYGAGIWHGVHGSIGVLRRLRATQPSRG